MTRGGGGGEREKVRELTIQSISKAKVTMQIKISSGIMERPDVIA